MPIIGRVSLQQASTVRRQLVILPAFSGFLDLHSVPDQLPRSLKLKPVSFTTRCQTLIRFNFVACSEGVPTSLANGKPLDYWRSSLSAPGSPGFAAHRVQAGSSAATTTLAPLVTAGQAPTLHQRQGQQGPHAAAGGGRGAVGGEERRTSAPAQGSAAAATAAAAAAPASAAAAPRLPHRFGNTNWRILSVDDDQINQVRIRTSTLEH